MEQLKQERALAFAKMYNERDQKNSWINKIYRSYANLVEEYGKGNHGVEEALWELATQIPLTQNHFTEYMCGTKTTKVVLKVKVKDATGEEKEIEKPYHFALGTRYKEWKKDDEPCFFMKSYFVKKNSYFTLNKYGFFVLKEEVLKKMSKGKRAKYEASWNGDDDETRTKQLKVWRETGLQKEEE